MILMNCYWHTQKHPPVGTVRPTAPDKSYPHLKRSCKHNCRAVPGISSNHHIENLRSESRYGLNRPLGRRLGGALHPRRALGIIDSPQRHWLLRILSSSFSSSTLDSEEDVEKAESGEGSWELLVHEHYYHWRNVEDKGQIANACHEY